MFDQVPKGTPRERVDQLALAERPGPDLDVEPVAAERLSGNGMDVLGNNTFTRPTWDLPKPRRPVG